MATNFWYDPAGVSDDVNKLYQSAGGIPWGPLAVDQPAPAAPVQPQASPLDQFNRGPFYSPPTPYTPPPAFNFRDPGPFTVGPGAPSLNPGAAPSWMSNQGEPLRPVPGQGTSTLVPTVPSAPPNYWTPYSVPNDLKTPIGPRLTVPNKGGASGSLGPPAQTAPTAPTAPRAPRTAAPAAPAAPAGPPEDMVELIKGNTRYFAYPNKQTGGYDLKAENPAAARMAETMWAADEIRDKYAGSAARAMLQQLFANLGSETAQNIAGNLDIQKQLAANQGALATAKVAAGAALGAERIRQEDERLLRQQLENALSADPAVRKKARAWLDLFSQTQSSSKGRSAGTPYENLSTDPSTPGLYTFNSAAGTYELSAPATPGQTVILGGKQWKVGPDGRLLYPFFPKGK